MKPVIAALQPPAGESRKLHAAGADAERPAIKPVQATDTANRHIPDFMTSIWCGAMMGGIGAAVIAPFPESRS